MHCSIHNNLTLITCIHPAPPITQFAQVTRGDFWGTDFLIGTLAAPGHRGSGMRLCTRGPAV